MRMWMVKPSYLCNKHLLGEHVELHMLVGSILKNKNLNGFIENELIIPSQIQKRHKSIVEEMIKRGYNHKSDLPEFDLPDKYKDIKITNSYICSSFYDLISRYSECSYNIKTDR